MIQKLAKLLFLILSPLLFAGIWILFLLQTLLIRISRGSSHAAASLAFPTLPSYPSPAVGPLKDSAVSIVIPNWNGRDLLEKYLSTVIVGCRPSDEIIVVDNASSDGSAEFVREHFPSIRLLEMRENLGFSGGSNAGVRAARHPVVVLLNNDMSVTNGFLQSLLDGFQTPDVFAVSAQIQFFDATRRREETGLTSGAFEKGFFRFHHDDDSQVTAPYPTLYAGGGSTAYDREKFLALGGFDPLFEPFYLEDTDLSFNAWRQGWQVLYQPRSRIVHEHRATIGKYFSADSIQTILQKNYVLMVWKNIARPLWLAQHFLYLIGHMCLNAIGCRSPTRTTVRACKMALSQLPAALRARGIALRQGTVADHEIFQRTRPSVYRDIFQFGSPHIRTNTAYNAPASDTGPIRPLNILFVSPYSTYPPLHGGAVLMHEAIRALSRKNNIFLLTFVDNPAEATSNQALRGVVRHVETFQRKHLRNAPFRLTSHAEQTFHDPEFAALLDRMVLVHSIDVIQFEYTQLAQYHLPLRHLPQCLFEHNVHFHSVQRQFFSRPGSLLNKHRELLEWLRSIRYEIRAVRKFDAVFTCHEQEQRLLESFLPRNRRPEIYSNLRTAVDVASYPGPDVPRQPDRLLFVGNFQHTPNADGLMHFCDNIWPRILANHPQAILSVVGANAPPEFLARLRVTPSLRFLGRVEEIREPLSSHSIFICPIRTGAGVRVKILEAFAACIPVVSTNLGAEGIPAVTESEILIADSSQDFASACLDLLEHPDRARAIAARARRLAESLYDWRIVGEKLDAIYRHLIRRNLSGNHLETDPVDYENTTISVNSATTGEAASPSSLPVDVNVRRD
jgi:GT2 family glycosyltransferase/glycosyltransferase involved in cell wall biosynthesis